MFTTILTGELLSTGKSVVAGCVKFVTTHIVPMVCITAIVIVGFYIDHQSTVISNQTQQISKLVEQNKQQQQTVTDLKKAVGDQNTWIQALTDATKKQAEAVQGARDAIQVLKSTSEKTTAKIIAGPTPSTCPSAMQYLKKAQGELKWSDQR